MRASQEGQNWGSSQRNGGDFRPAYSIPALSLPSPVPYTHRGSPRLPKSASERSERALESRERAERASSRQWAERQRGATGSPAKPAALGEGIPAIPSTLCSQRLAALAEIGIFEIHQILEGRR